MNRRVIQYVARLQDLMSGPLARITQVYARQSGRWQQFGKRMQAGFRLGSQTVDQLRRRLLSLPNLRLRVDSSALNKANQQAQQLAGNMARQGRDGRWRLPDGRFANMGGGSGSRGGGFGMSGLNMEGLVRKVLPYVSAAAIGSAALSFGTKAMALERDEFSLGVMLRSKSQAHAMMGQFEEFSKKNPLVGMKETTETGTRLISLNERTDRIMPIIRTLSDVAAGTKAPMSELAYVLGQIKSKGIYRAEEREQFADRNLNIDNQLSKLTGIALNKLPDAMKDGRVGYEQVLRALNMMTVKGGVYDNMSERAGQETSEGRLKNLLETLELQFSKLAIRVLPYVNEGLDLAIRLSEGLQVQLNGPLGTAFMQAVHGFSEMGQGFAKFAIDSGLVSTKAGEAGTAMNALVTSLEAVGNIARWIGKVAKEAAPYIKAIPVVGMQAAGLEGLKWFNKFSNEKLGQPTIKRKPVSVATNEEKWLKGAGVTGMSAADQHERYEEARWRSAQRKTDRSAFDRLSDAQKHAKFLSSQAKALKENKTLLGASGLLPEGLVKKKKGKGKGDDDGVSAAVRGARSTTINITINKLVDGGVHVHTTTFQEGIQNVEEIVTDALLRVVNSGNSLSLDDAD